MLSAETVLTFFTASLLLGVAPGPDNLFVLTQSTLHGRAAGLVVMLGLCTGLIAHSLAVALGAAAVFQSSAVAFSVLKFCGAGYLLYLAWRTFSAKPASLSGGGVQGGPGRGELYRRGIIMSLTNPKLSISFWRSCRSLPTRRVAPWPCRSCSSAVYSSLRLFLSSAASPSRPVASATGCYGQAACRSRSTG